MIPITRKQALELNLPRYFTNKPCKNGHINERFVSTWCCVECVNNRKKTYYEDHKDHCYTQSKKWKHENPSNVAKHNKKWNDNNADKLLEIRNKRRAAKLQAVPPWYDNERNEILNLYTKSKELTKNTGIQYSVDHIYPIQGELVCGLHCLSNLQILTLSENSAKGNDMPLVS